MKNKGIFKILSGLLALILIGGLLIITSAFVGNPLSSFKAGRAAKKHIEENYSHLNIRQEKPIYNFKNGDYSISVYSESSQDTQFNIFYWKGKVTDDYEFRVGDNFNTIMRLEREYSSLVKEIIEKELTYEDRGSWVIYNKDDYEDILGQLQLDMDFDRSLPFEAEVHLEVLMDEPSLEKAARLLEDTHRAFLKGNCHFQTYNSTNGDGKEILSVYNVRPDQIESGNLLTLLEEAEKRPGETYEGIHIFNK